MESTVPPDSESKVIFQYEEETKTQKLARKSRDNPFMVFGLTGCTLAVIYGTYRFKYRGNLSISNYLMQLRVAAQGTVIGCLSVGVCYQLYQRFIAKPSDT